LNIFIVKKKFKKRRKEKSVSVISMAAFLDKRGLTFAVTKPYRKAQMVYQSA
jgi:hypothetical protein